jgi:heterodisulfide reductase subunit B2
MKVSYYPGCSLEETAQAYDISARKVCQTLGIDLEEIPQWSCCGSSPALKMNHLLSTALGAHNLAQAQRQHLSEVVIPCPFCFRRLLSAQQEVQADRQLKSRVEASIGADLSDDLNIFNLLGFLRYSVGLEAAGAKVKKPLKNLKVLPYYGCYLVKPGTVTHYDDAENPVSMDQILASLGAEVLQWDFKTECCGASLTISKTEKVCELSGRMIREAAWRGADAVVVACQVCQANLDIRQAEIGRNDKKRYAIPILYFTQLMGLAFGIPYKDLGLTGHIVNPKKMLASKDLLQ